MTTMIESTIQANGIDLHYWRAGERGVPPLLCLHGLTDSGRCWETFASDFGSGYDVIMPDARGHGLSGRPEHGYRTEDRVADTLALLDALGIAQTLVIGHSMGGDQAAMLAAVAPERMRAAILEDPAFRHGESDWLPNTADNWATGLLAEQDLGYARLVEQARRDRPHWDPRCLDAWAESKQQCSPLAFNWLREPRSAWGKYVAKIAVPTLVITAEPARGAIIDAATEATLVGLSPHLQVVRLADAGHSVRYEQPAAFVAAARAFFAAHQ